jgi:hypothetical protein
VAAIPPWDLDERRREMVSVKLDGEPTARQQAVLEWLGDVEDYLGRWVRRERQHFRKHRHRIAASLTEAAHRGGDASEAGSTGESSATGR